MNRLPFALIMLIGVGCAVPVYTNDNPDEFVDIAVAWNGAHIKDMISVWGQPNGRFAEPSEYTFGYASWVFDESIAIQEAHEKQLAKRRATAEQNARITCDGTVDQWGNVSADNCETRKVEVYDNSITHDLAMAYARKCSVMATFDTDGTIVKIDAKSKGCSGSNTEELQALVRRK